MWQHYVIDCNVVCRRQDDKRVLLKRKSLSSGYCQLTAKPIAEQCRVAARYIRLALVLSDLLQRRLYTDDGPDAVRLICDIVNLCQLCLSLSASLILTVQTYEQLSQPTHV